MKFADFFSADEPEKLPDSAESAETTEVASQPAVNSYTALQRRYRQFLAIIRSGETPDAQDLQDFLHQCATAFADISANETTLPPNAGFRMSHPDIQLLGLPMQHRATLETDSHSEWQYRTVRKHLQTGEPANLADVFLPVIPPPLKILLILPSHAYQPVDEESRQPYYYEKRLREMLLSLISDCDVEIRILPSPTRAALARELSRHPCHIVYYWGGGAVENGENYLAFENPLTLETEWVLTSDVAALMRNPANPVPLLFWSFYPDSPAGTEQDQLSGIETFCRAGIPAVISTGEMLAPTTAISFAEQLFRELAKRQTLQESFANAIESLQAKTGQFSWAFPNFFENLIVHYPADWQAKPQSPQQIVPKTNLLAKHYEISPQTQMFPVMSRQLKRNMLDAIENHTGLFLRGQTGSGKTALAQWLLQQFADAYSNAITVWIDAKQIRDARTIIQLLKNELKNKNADAALENLNYQPDSEAKFMHLAHELAALQPLAFCFANIDELTRNGHWLPEYSDIAKLAEYLCRSRRFPLIFTGKAVPKALTALKIISPDGAPAPLWEDLPVFADACRSIANQSAAENDAPNIRQLWDKLVGNCNGNAVSLKIYSRAGMHRLSEWLAAPAAPVAKKQRVSPKKNNQDLLDEMLVQLDPQLQALLFMLLQFRIAVQTDALTGQFQAAENDMEFRTTLLDMLAQLTNLGLLEVKLDPVYHIEYYQVTEILSNRLAPLASQMTHLPFDAIEAGNYHFRSYRFLGESLTELKCAFEQFSIAGEALLAKKTGQLLIKQLITDGNFDAAIEVLRRMNSVSASHFGMVELRQLADLLSKLERFPAAQKTWHQLLQRANREKNRQFMRIAYEGIAENCHKTADVLTAKKMYLACLKLCRELQDAVAECRVLRSLGELNLVLGDKTAAVKQFQNAQKLAEKLNDPQEIWHIQTKLSEAFEMQGNTDKALNELDLALENATRQNFRRKIAQTRFLRGKLYRLNGELSEATADFEAALTIGQEIADRSLCKKVLSHLIDIAGHRNEYQRILHFLDEQLNLCRIVGNLECECQTLRKIGQHYMELRNFESAATVFRQCKNLADRLKMTDELAESNYSLGEIALEHEQFTTATNLLTAALAIFREKSNTGWMRKCLFLLSIVNQKQGFAAEAFSCWREVLRLNLSGGQLSDAARQLLYLPDFLRSSRLIIDSEMRKELLHAIQTVNGTLNAEAVLQLQNLLKKK